MKWHKVEDYPIKFDEYVLVSPNFSGVRTTRSCFTAKLKDGFWDDGMDMCTEVESTDRWCYIDLPED